MNFVTKMYIKAREHKAQTMTEYALIMAAIAVVCIAAYQALGTKIVSLVNQVTSNL